MTIAFLVLLSLLRADSSYPWQEPIVVPESVVEPLPLPQQAGPDDPEPSCIPDNDDCDDPAETAPARPSPSL